MSIKEKLLAFLKGKKGNALLLTVAGAIAATFGTYFFVAITTLSETNKQRVTHLYNAYQMGLAVRGKLDGTDMNLGRLTDEIGFNTATLNALQPTFANGNFVTLKTMVKEEIIAIGQDPTSGIAYDLDNSGGLISYADENGTAIDDNASAAIVRDIQLKVNLAGTNNADATTANGNPYAQGTPFYYIVMDAGGSTGSLGLTVTTPDSAYSILSSEPQAEGSVILPSDFFSN